MIVERPVDIHLFTCCCFVRPYGQMDSEGCSVVRSKTVCFDLAAVELGYLLHNRESQPQPGIL